MWITECCDYEETVVDESRYNEVAIVSVGTVLIKTVVDVDSWNSVAFQLAIAQTAGFVLHSEVDGPNSIVLITSSFRLCNKWPLNIMAVIT